MPANLRRIAIIGGVASGTAAAAEAKRQAPDANVVLFEQREHIAYGSCEMPYYVGGQIDAIDPLINYTPAQFERKKGVVVHTRHAVRAIDPRKKTLTVDALDHGSTHTEPYDQLILATGARANRLDIEGSDAPNVLPLRRLEDAIDLRAWLENEPVKHVVVVGGGYTGLEVAEAVRRRGLRATVLSPNPVLGKLLSDEIRPHVEQHIRAHGVTLRDERAERFETDRHGRVVAVWTDKKEKIGCQLVVVAIGITPNNELAAAAGAKLEQPWGTVAVGSDMKTSLPNVWACGDLVTVNRVVDDRKIHLPLSPVAFNTARVAARNAARRGRGDVARFPGVVGIPAVQLFGMEATGVGLCASDAREAGFDVVTQTVRRTSRVPSYPGARPLWITLVADRRSRRLLGGQLVGEEGAALRGNTLVPCLRERYTVDQFLDLDLMYTPPLAPSHDPLLVCAAKLRDRLK